MDIRNYFGSKSGNSNAGAKSEPTKTVQRPKPRLSNSSDDDFSKSRNSGEKKQRKSTNQSHSKKRHKNISDSEEDIIPSSEVKSKNGCSKKTGEKVEKLKPVKAEDFFGAAASSSSCKNMPKIPKIAKKAAEQKPSSDDKKRKNPEPELFDDDDDFESMMVDIDFDQDIVKPSPIKKSKLDGNEDEESKKLLPLKLLTKLKTEEREAKKVEKDTKSNGEETKRNDKRSKDYGRENGQDDKERSKRREEKDREKRSEENGWEKKKEKRKSEEKPKTSPAKIKIEEKIVPIKVEPKFSSPVEIQTKEKLLPIKIEPKSQSSQSQSSSNSSSQSMDGESSQLWVEKYKPTSSKAIIGQQGDSSNMRKLTNWLKQWDTNNAGKGKNTNPKPPPWNSGADNGFWAKAALLSGPPGVGKTTTAYLVAKELGFDVMELNASDTRSKKQLEAVVSDAVNSQSLSKVSTKRVLLMDEVDGMAGNEDRGGVAELIQLIKGARIPVVCMCNDRNHPKIRSLANHCFDLRFHRPKIEQIRAAMMSICFKEKLKIGPDALNELISGCNQDVRQVLHHLSMVKAKDLSDSVDGKYSLSDAKEEADRGKKTSIKIGPWDVCRKVFSSSEQKSMSLSDKSDLFFHDYSIGPLFVQENYLAVMPNAAGHDPKKAILLASKAADSLCNGDLVEKLIRSQNSWSLLPAQAMFSSVLPGEYMSGHIQGMIQFPNWLGKNSKQNKIDRILQELQMHTRLSAGQSKRCLNLDFCQHLRDAILRPMVKQGGDGVQESVQVMSHYSMLREDLDNLLEVTQWPNSSDPMKSIESKVKGAFTRSYNKDVILPYATSLGSISKKSAAVVTGEPLLDGEEEEEDDNMADDDNIESDAMIKAKKPKASKAPAAEGSQSAKGSQTAKGSQSAKAGRGGKASGGRGGRGKK